MPHAPGPFSWQNIKSLFRGRIPGQLIIQFSDRCNARCPQCEMRVQNKYDRSTLDVASVERAIDSASEKGVQAVSFTGGEPFLFQDEIIHLIEHASKAGIPYIRTGTNGFMFCGSDKPNFETKVRRFAERLADTNLYTFWISIDSADTEVHEQMRGLPGVIKGIEKALPIFHEYGIYPSANLGINRNAGGDYHKLLPDVPAEEEDPRRIYDYFRDGFDRFYRKAANLGFSIVNMCYPMSVDPDQGDSLAAVYSATASDRIVRFRPDEKIPLFQAVYDTVPQHRSKIRIFTPLVSLKALIKQYQDGEKSQYGCRGGIDFFFMDSKNGNTYPCGYRGSEDLGKFWELDTSKINKTANCTDCDWECFRDPSELTGPFLDLFSHPLRTSARLMSDREWTRLWRTDLKYYRACDYFCGRVPANKKKLARFAAAPTNHETTPPSESESESLTSLVSQ